MKSAAFFLSDKVKVHDVVHYHYPPFWRQFSFPDFVPAAAAWSDEIRYLSANDRDISAGIKALPRNAGGIYLFFIKGNILPPFETYLAYIGRAQLSSTHSLWERCRKYYYEFFDEEHGRPQITRLLGKWGPHLYLRYLALTDNEQIRRLEAELINAILPPFNEEIPDKIVKQAVAAF